MTTNFREMFLTMGVATGGGGRWVLGPKITLIIRFVQQGNLVLHVTSHREILYGPLYGALRCDIFPIFMAISLHLTTFHKIIRPQFHYEALISYVSCIVKALGPRKVQPYSTVFEWGMRFGAPGDVTVKAAAEW